MTLKGDLKSINLATVLQDLASNELTGTLTIRTPQQKRHFWFEKGRLRLVGLGNGKGPIPLNGLLALGKVRATDVSQKTNVSLVRGLVRKGSVTRDDVRAALEQQMNELICDAFVWTDASFEFVEGDPDEDEFETSQLDHEIRLQADPIVMEALRRVDEWSEIRKSVISPEEILVTLRERAAADGDATIERVATLFDGERRLRDIIDLTHLGEFSVFRAAAALLRSGSARALTVKEAVDKGRATAGKKQHAQALKMARFALAREPQNVEARVLAAEALEALERADEAASEYRQLVAVQAEHGQHEEAVATCRKILALAPRDSFTHERLFGLLVLLRKKSEALQQGESLAVTYKRAGLPDKAKEVYTRLIQAFGDDDDLLESAGELARRLGDKKEAITLYRRLFERALARGDNDAIIQHARTILRLDPTAEDVAKRRMEVETGVYRKRQKFRQRVKILVTLGVLMVVLAGVISYEFRARAFLADVRKEGVQLLQKKEFAPLIRRYNEFLDAYGWSLSVAEVQRERNDLEALYLEEALPKLPVADNEVLRELAKAQEVRALVRQKALKDRAEEVRLKLSQQAGELGNRFIQDAVELARDGSPAALERISRMTHPLALEAVQQLAGHESAAVRRAAVKSLGENGSYKALRTLVERLAADPDAGVKGEALDWLRRKTGEDHGFDPTMWSESLLKRQAAREGVPPLNVSLTCAKAVIGAGQPVVAEYRLENIGGTTLEFAFAPEFEAADSANKKVPLRDPPPRAPSHAQLRPGEFVGGRMDLRDLGLESPGYYLIVCVARVSWAGGAGEVRIKSLPVTVELKKP